MKRIVSFLIISVLCIAHGQAFGDGLGSNSATWSPSITIKNQSNYDLVLRFKLVDANGQASWGDVRVPKGASYDLLRQSNGTTVQSILPITYDGKIFGPEKVIHANDSIITITKSDLK